MKDGASTSLARTGVLLLQEALIAMRKAASRALPCEACGVLLGSSTEVKQFIETVNVHPTPETHFEIDPQALIHAHKNAREGGPEIIGYFHSHPIGDAKPSETDCARAAHDGKLWIIAGVDGLGCWRDDPKGFLPLSYSIATS